MKRFLLKSIFLASCLLTGALGESQDDVKALEQMMEISPYKNIPQNKNIQNTLKNKQSPLDIKKGNEKIKQDSNPQTSLQDNSKELLDEDGLVMPNDEEFRFKYKIIVETKEDGKSLTLKDLGINEIWLNEAIVALKKSDLSV